jgi:hypothetical protein
MSRLFLSGHVAVGNGRAESLLTRVRIFLDPEPPPPPATSSVAANQAAAEASTPHEAKSSVSVVV